MSTACRILMSSVPGALALALVLGLGSPVLADGKIVAPRLYQGKPYRGSLEEGAQEAIIIFNGSGKARDATEDLILKVQVRGEVDQFAWVIPFPSEPTIKDEDARLFEELHQYVEAR